MPKATTITMEEWLAEIERVDNSAPRSQSKGMTAAELSVIWNLPVSSTRKRLAAAQSQGFLRRGRKYTEDVSGRMNSVPCYWFEETKPTGKKKP